LEQMTLINAWGSNRRRVSNKCWVSIKRQGFEVRVLINAGGVYYKFYGMCTIWYFSAAL